jgi:hypothetical protein
MTTTTTRKSKVAKDSAPKTIASKKTSTPTATPAAWKGEEVEDRRPTADSPEARASRAEGNTPVLARVAVRQAQVDERDGTETEEKNDDARPSSASDDEENAEEKRIAAAEEHAAALARHHPRGSL